jgi:hypothetical protein
MLSLHFSHAGRSRAGLPLRTVPLPARVCERTHALSEAIAHYERLRALMDESRAMGSSATVYETALHLAQCVISAGRPQHGLEIIGRAAGETTEDVTIFDASRAVVAAKALIDLGFIEEAVETIAAGAELARVRHLEFELARLLLLAGRIGPPFDSRLGTTEPAEEAHHLLDRLGVVSTVLV